MEAKQGKDRTSRPVNKQRWIFPLVLSAPQSKTLLIARVDGYLISYRPSCQGQFPIVTSTKYYYADPEVLTRCLT